MASLTIVAAGLIILARTGAMRERLWQFKTARGETNAVNLSVVAGLIQQGDVDALTPTFAEGETMWRSAGSFPELRALLPQPVPLPASLDAVIEELKEIRRGVQGTRRYAGWLLAIVVISMFVGACSAINAASEARRASYEFERIRRGW